MSLIDTMIRFTRIDGILDECLADSSREDLINCIKFLAVELAQHQNQHGPLTGQDLQQLLVSDQHSAQTLTDGLMQSATALAQVTGRHEVLNRLRQDLHLVCQDEQLLKEMQPISQSERLFYHETDNQGRSGWYFSVRGGRIYGPLSSETDARTILEGMVLHYQESGDTGGR